MSMQYDNSSRYVSSSFPTQFLIQPILSSWGLSYNLYADKLLKLNVFPDSVYQMRKSP